MFRNNQFYIDVENAQYGKVRLGYRIYKWYAKYGNHNRPYIIYVYHPKDNHLVPLRYYETQVITAYLFPTPDKCTDPDDPRKKLI